MDLVTVSFEDQPPGDQPGAEQAGVGPWAAPGPDLKWWRGAAPDDPDEPPRRPSPARHRGRRAVPVDPPPPTESGPAATAVALAEPVEAAPDPDLPWPAPNLRAGRLPRTTVRAPKPPRVRRRALPGWSGPSAGPRAALTRRPLPGLVALVLFGLLAVFFSWVSAEPLWLSLGHGTAGTATVANCQVHGITKRCADFTAAGGAFTAEKVALLGTGPVEPGRKVPARMVSAASTAAYTGSLPVRWATGLSGVLLCGFAIAWLTGAYRLPRRRARLGALALSVAGPVLLAAGVLAATW